MANRKPAGQGSSSRIVTIDDLKNTALRGDFYEWHTANNHDARFVFTCSDGSGGATVTAGCNGSAGLEITLDSPLIHQHFSVDNWRQMHFVFVQSCIMALTMWGWDRGYLK